MRALSQRCRVCGCTNMNCTLCVVRTGQACHWVEPDLCSACALSPKLPVMRMLRVNECGSKTYWDMTKTGSLQEVIQLCEEHDRVVRNIGSFGSETSGRYLIKDTASSQRLLPQDVRCWHVWIEKDDDTGVGRAAALKRCMSEQKEFELMLSSSGLLWLLKIAATLTGRWKRHDLTQGGGSNRMKGEDLAWLLQAGYLQESGKWVEVTDQGNALVRDVLTFAQKWEGGAK